MTIVDTRRGRPFTSESGRKAGLLSGQVRRRAAAERYWSQFIAALVISEHYDRLAGRFAKKFDRIAG